MNKDIMRVVLAVMLLAGLSAIACAESSDAAGEYDATSTITFNGNGGSGTVPPQKVLDGNSIELPVTGYSKSGSYLSGWLQGSSDGVHLEPGSAFTVSGDTVLYAEWTAVPDHFDVYAVSSVTSGNEYRYTPYSDYEDSENRPMWVEFAVNYMMFSQDPMYECTVVRDSVPEWMNIAVSNGYVVTFSGTCHVPGVYLVGIHLNIDGPAGFEKNYPVSWIVSVAPEHQGETFTVSFDANGGDGSIVSSNAQYANGVVLPSDGMSRDGYTLVGWKIPVDGTEATFPLGSVYTVRSDIQAKAHWVADPNIIVLDANGGESTDRTAYIASTDGVIALPSTGFEMSGCVLAGWYLTSDDSAVFAPGYLFTVSGAATFKAYWIPEHAETYQAAFDTNGGHGASTQIVEPGKEIVLPSYGFSRDGMELTGWTMGSSDDVLPCGSAVGIVGGTTFHAHWEAASSSVTVTFDLNGGYGSLPVQSVEKGSTIGQPSDPSRSAFVFIGWKQIGGGSWDFGNIAEHSMTLQAQWSQHYTADRNGNTVTISMASDWTAFGTVIEWGDGTESKGYDTMYSHTYSDDLTTDIVVKSVNGGNVEGESSIPMVIGSGVPHDDGGGENDDGNEEKNDSIDIWAAVILVIAVISIIAVATRFL